MTQGEMKGFGKELIETQIALRRDANRSCDRDKYSYPWNKKEGSGNRKGNDCIRKNGGKLAYC